MVLLLFGSCWALSASYRRCLVGFDGWWLFWVVVLWLGVAVLSLCFGVYCLVGLILVGFRFCGACERLWVSPCCCVC